MSLARQRHFRVRVFVSRLLVICYTARNATGIAMAAVILPSGRTATLAPAARPGEPILVVDDIVKTFASAEGVVTALDHVSLTVSPGEFLGVIGPSGCGKSTLFNIIGGLLDGYDGTVKVAGERVASLDEQPRLLLGDKVLAIQQQLKQTTLLITHNITEAVQLSDRILVMTYRPGRLKRMVEIKLPRPRTSEIVSSEAFGRYV